MNNLITSLKMMWNSELTYEEKLQCSSYYGYRNIIDLFEVKHPHIYETNKYLLNPEDLPEEIDNLIASFGNEADDLIDKEDNYDTTN